MIGGSQLWLIQRGDCQRATLGYWVLNQFWNNGYGHEIGEGTIKQGIEVLALNRIEAEIIPQNIQSIRLSAKLGMKSEGIRRQSLFGNGKWLDHEVFAITASDLGLKNRHPDPAMKSIV
jgi:ribosomal-protein-alanine N-acetyltransferase